jgi:hypothetical protein
VFGNHVILAWVIFGMSSLEISKLPETLQKAFRHGVSHSELGFFGRKQESGGVLETVSA